MERPYARQSATAWSWRAAADRDNVRQFSFPGNREFAGRTNEARGAGAAGAGARRRQVRERFAEARRRLQQAGFLETLQQFPMWTGPEIHERGQAYHALQIPCPFLEDERCSVYADRPIACREYLVTSPPEYCATADRTAIRGVSMPVSFFAGLAR